MNIRCVLNSIFKYRFVVLLILINILPGNFKAQNNFASISKVAAAELTAEVNEAYNQDSTEYELHILDDKKKQELVTVILICGIIILLIAFGYVCLILNRNKITVKKLQEKERLLAIKELEMTLSLEAGGIGVAKYDIENDQYFRDEKFYKYLGYTSEDLKRFNKGIFNILFKDDIPIMQRYLNEIYDRRPDDKYSITVRIYKKDKTLATILLLGKITELTKDGLPKTIHGVIVDITQKSKIKSENLRLVEFLKLALTEYGMSTWEWNREGNTLCYHFLLSNNHLYSIAKELLDHTGDELKVQPGWYDKYIHNDDLELVNKFRHKYMTMHNDSETKNLDVHYRIIIGENTYTIYQQAKVIEFNDNGLASKVIGIVHDVTERVKEEENRAQSTKLEAIGALAGGVAHDFNNQLNGILGFVDLIKKTEGLETNSTVQKYLKIIKDCGERCEGLTSQLLTFARKGKEKQEIFDIHLAINNMVDMLKHTVDRSIDISSKFSALLHNIEGDKNQIENSLLNIMLNSCDAMIGGGSISIETDDKIDPYIEKSALFKKYAYQQVIIIKITDTGSGMDKKVLSKIFEPFFTTKEVGKGTGMGLAFVFGVIKDHLGEIYVESSVGVGTTTYICLPVKSEVRSSGIGEEDIDNIDFNNKLFGKILVVDDEASVRILLKNYLSSFGCEVELAANGEEAVEIYMKMQGEISLVICDISMPRMSGPEALLKLKKINEDVKVILITGYAENDEKVVFMLKNGASDLLKKPLNREKLYQGIRKVLGQ